MNAPTSTANSSSVDTAGSMAHFSAGEYEQIEFFMDRVNDSMEDTVMLVARWVADADDIAAALITAVDYDGVELMIDATRHWVPFSERALRFDHIQVRVFELVDRARAARPDDPTTRLERRRVLSRQLAMVECDVSAVRPMNDRLVEITFGPLDEFTSLGGDQAVTLIIDTPERPVPVGFDPAKVRDYEPQERPIGATYTVRRFNAADRTIDIWMVLHDHDGQRSSAHPSTISGWAAGAAPGDRIKVWGPRITFGAPEGTTSMLLVCDETGYGAVGSLIDDAGPATEIHVIAETTDPAHEVLLSDRDGVTISWLYRRGDAPGTGTRLVDAVRACTLPTNGLFAFGAAESRAISAVRKHLRRERGLPAAQVNMTGYWRRTP